MKTLVRIGLVGCLVVLGGCLKLPTREEPIGVVAPQPTVAVDPDWPEVAWSLAVQRPITDQTRGSVRIVVRTAQSRLAFYPGVAWLDEMPDMVQTLLLNAFADSGRFPSVARPGTAAAYYGLTAEVRRFDAVEGPNRALRVELELQVGLVEMRSGRMIASRVFKSESAVAGSEVLALTRAFEAALSTLLTDVVGWTVNSALPGR